MKILITLFAIFNTLTYCNEITHGFQSHQYMPYEKEYLKALTIDQKNLYQNQKWDHFFANAYFYRTHFLKNKASLKHNFIESIIALELIAYSKHCQWQEAQTIANDLIKKSNKRHIKIINNIVNKTKLLKTIPQKQHKLKEVNINNRIIWKMNNQSIKKVKHPRNIIYRVENKCT